MPRFLTAEWAPVRLAGRPHSQPIVASVKGLKKRQWNQQSSGSSHSCPGKHPAREPLIQLRTGGHRQLGGVGTGTGHSLAVLLPRGTEWQPDSLASTKKPAARGPDPPSAEQNPPHGEFSGLGWAGGGGRGCEGNTSSPGLCLLVDQADQAATALSLSPSGADMSPRSLAPGVPGQVPPPRPRQQGPSWVRSGGGRALSCVQTPPGPALNSLSSRPCLPEGERGLWLLCKYAFQRPLLSHPASSPNPHYELAGLSEGPSGS